MVYGYTPVVNVQEINAAIEKAKANQAKQTPVPSPAPTPTPSTWSYGGVGGSFSDTIAAAVAASVTPNKPSQPVPSQEEAFQVAQLELKYVPPITSDVIANMGIRLPAPGTIGGTYTLEKTYEPVTTLQNILTGAHYKIGSDLYKMQESAIASGESSFIVGNPIFEAGGKNYKIVPTPGSNYQVVFGKDTEGNVGLGFRNIQKYKPGGLGDTLYGPGGVMPPTKEDIFTSALFPLIADLFFLSPVIYKGVSLIPDYAGKYFNSMENLRQRGYVFSGIPTGRGLNTPTSESLGLELQFKEGTWQQMMDQAGGYQREVLVASPSSFASELNRMLYEVSPTEQYYQFGIRPVAGETPGPYLGIVPQGVGSPGLSSNLKGFPDVVSYLEYLPVISPSMSSLVSGQGLTFGGLFTSSLIKNLPVVSPIVYPTVSPITYPMVSPIVSPTVSPITGVSVLPSYSTAFSNWLQELVETFNKNLNQVQDLLQTQTKTQTQTKIKTDTQTITGTPVTTITQTGSGTTSSTSGEGPTNRGPLLPFILGKGTTKKKWLRSLRKSFGITPLAGETPSLYVYMPNPLGPIEEPLRPRPIMKRRKSRVVKSRQYIVGFKSMRL